MEQRRRGGFRARGNDPGWFGGSRIRRRTATVRLTMDRTTPMTIDRRTLLAGGAAMLAPHAWPAVARQSAAALKDRAAAKGLKFGASFSVAELDQPYGTDYAEIYKRDCGLLTSELEFKMGVMRPNAGTIDFAPADRLIQFANENGLGLRGHTLIWNDYLPDWIHDLGPGEVEHLLEAHIETVLERYKDRVASWDIVNEPIGPWDRLPGNLRKGPYLTAFGEDYITRSFQIARKAAPGVELVLNEAQTESDDENGETFRTSLYALLQRLKDKGAPIDAVGLQCHIDTARPYDFGRFAQYVQSIADLGYRILITELDVNDRALPSDVAARDAAVAKIYADFLGRVLSIKAVTTLTLWQMADHTSWIYYDAVAKAPRAMRRPRPLIYDAAFRPKPAWDALAAAIDAMPAR
jgi:endo-1,4-beta-xylanase